MYLLDTNIVIHFLEASPPAHVMEFLGKIVDEECNISVITKMEALGFNFKTMDEQQLMTSFIDGSNVIFINDNIVANTIAIRKSKKIGLPDAIIAATALFYNLIILTRNISDFNGIEGLKTMDPWN